MRSRRHLARRSVGHLWHFIKCRSWLPRRERKSVRGTGGETKRKSRRKRGTAQSGFITRWPAESGTRRSGSSRAAMYELDASISLRPGAPRWPFNIGQAAMPGPRRGSLRTAVRYARVSLRANEKWDRSTRRAAPRRVPWPRREAPRERRRYARDAHIILRLPSLWCSMLVFNEYSGIQRNG